MIETAAPAPVPHPWSKAALFAKAQRYAEGMLRYGRNDWQFGLWSTFMLEFVARAALAHISPALLADSKDWNHLYFAIGGKPKAPKFIPRSLEIGKVLDHLNEIVTNFDSGRKGVATEHIEKRNKELHSGATAFDGGSTEWLGKYYDACAVLLESMNETLATLLGTNEADAAGKLIAAARDESAKAVDKAIHQHRTDWESKGSDERTALTQKAALWATRDFGHCVKCPACGSQALFVGGEPIAEAKMTIENGMVIEKQDYLPSKFECVACGFKIAGLAQIAAAGLGNSFTSTRTYDLGEYFGDQAEFDGFEDDNNEP